MEVKKKVVGRPTGYTPELGKEICETITCTSKGIKSLCKEIEHWPSHNSIYRWLSAHKEFSDLYARAKRQQIEVLVNEVLEIADDSSNDSVINDDGKEVTDHEHINRARLRIDTRKWLVAKLCPRLYGDMKDASVNLNFPSNPGEATALLPMSSEVLRALANQEITPDQARNLINLIKDHGANIVVDELGKRIIELETKHNAKGEE
jgi:hypothetical protein